MTAAHPVDVVIAGAGPTGLTLACEVIRHGATCRIVEPLAKPTTYSKAAVVHARTMEVFDAMGMAAMVLEHTRTLLGGNIHAGGAKVAHLSFQGLDSAYPHAYGISQRDTEQVLAGHLQRLGGTVERGTRLESFTQESDRVQVSTVRDDGRRELIQARFLVGCDGAHSTVRKGLGFAFEGAPYEERLIQADLRVAFRNPPRDDEVQIHLDPRGPVMLFPLFKDGRYRVIVLDTDSARPPEGGEPGLAEFQQALDLRGVEASVSDPAWTVAFRIHHRRVERLREGRVFLAGDAAHIHSPVGGQGMNAGIQDAFNLGWKLAAVARGQGRERLLDSYEPERLPIIRALVAGTDRATRLMRGAVRLRHPLAQALRNALIRTLADLDLVTGQAFKRASMLAIAYGRSPLSGQDLGGLWKASAWAAFRGGPEPGMRAPDGLVTPGDGATSRRVHELLRDGAFVALLFAGEAPAPELVQSLVGLSAMLRKRHGARVAPYLVSPERLEGAQVPTLIDPDGVLHRRYRARAGGIQILRPDGYLGYRAQPAEPQKVAAWLDRLLVPQP